MLASQFFRAAAVALAIGLSATVSAQVTACHSFEAGDGTFLLSGEPFVVKAAELHYPRIPQPYWDQRIKLCKALGMNTVCLYVFWNVHETEPGVFDFEGQNDLRRFVKLCAQNDMKVILRPGPYVCAEWEMGGLPWWLLRDKDIELRSLDPRFMQAVDRFQKAVAAEVGDLTVKDGGPIIMVQVENEFGAYGTDKPYVSAVRDMLRRNFGPDVMLFQCDWSSNFLNNGLDDLVWTLNFGTGADVEQQFAPLRAARPESPLMCSEFWSGWFDKWGASHETRPAADMIAGIDEMLSKGISFSLYMTHGGTNWGHWAGANSPGYAPDVTSYDYDAPINEWGRPTPKYHALRGAMARHNGGAPLPPLPDSIPVMEIGRFALTEVAPLFGNLPAPVATGDSLRTMEEYGIGYGSMLYTAGLPALPSGGTLVAVGVHDYGRVFVNGVEAGRLDRRLGQSSLMLPATDSPARLDILVEAMGRINFGRTIKDFKGLTGPVEVALSGGDTLSLADGWTVRCLPDSLGFYKAMDFSPLESTVAPDGGRLPAGVYRGKFNVDKCADTFLLFDSWGKGLVYVNGHPLGRIWEIGPQQTLYMPGCWLREGENEIVVFDILGPRRAESAGLREPVLDRLAGSEGAASAINEAPDLTGLSPVAEGTLTPGNGWQKVAFSSPSAGRYLCLEMLDAAHGGDVTSVAELYLDAPDGSRLPREGWKASYATAEEREGNHTAEKAFDLQESTYWSTGSGTPFPHLLVIDLGSEVSAVALEYLPRMEPGAPGAAGRYRIYMLP